jgi:hypothetical protein
MAKLIRPKMPAGTYLARRPSTYEFVLVELEARRPEWPKVARQLRMSRHTLDKIGRQISRQPSVRTIERLARLFDDENRVSARKRRDRAARKRRLAKAATGERPRPVSLPIAASMIA